MTSASTRVVGDAAAPALAQRPSQRQRRVVRWIRRLPIRIIVAVLLIIEVYPLLWVLLGSFKSQREFLNNPFWELPKRLSLTNYANAFTKGDFGRYIINSVVTVVPALLLSLAIGVAAGFALQVMVWKGRRSVLLLFLTGIMVPGQMVLLPLFTIYFHLHLTQSLWPLFITYTATGLPLTVFMMATYFRAIPMEVFEAAVIDGASFLRCFRSIGVPMVRNAVLTVGLVQFFFLWNDLLIAVTFTSTSKLRTIQVGLLNFTGEYGSVQYGPLFAAICVSIFGTLFIYLFLNQRVMKGLTAGSVKG
jgi:raffinose/stachyose/melibiose transport system permease protein